MADRADALSHLPAAARRRDETVLRMAIGLIAVLELCWLAWFLVEPLPNAGNVGGNVRRGFLLMRALPEVVPGVTWEQSQLGLAAAELSHVGNLPQRIPIVLGATLIAGAAVALGCLVLRALRLRETLTVFERIPLAFGLGTVGLGLATLACGRLGLLSPWGTRIALGMAIAAEAACSLRGRGSYVPIAVMTGDGAGPYRTASLVAFAMVVGPFLLIMALGAMLPTIDFDCLEYHLQGPKEYFQAGRIAFLPHNVYTSMPFGVEMLHLLGMEVAGDWWAGALVGQLLVMLHAPAAAALIALTARRWGSPRAGWFAVVVYLTTPWIYRLAVIPYVEGPLCYYHAALLWTASRALDWPSAIGRQPPALSFWAVLGLLAGGAMACKYPALISAVIPFGLLAATRKSWRVILAFAAGCAVAIGPWLVKNVVDTGNPVYPLAYGVFGGKHWDAAADAKWRSAHGPRPVSAAALADGLLDVAGRSDWQSPLYAALAPLALLRRGSRRVVALLLGYCVYLFATWWLLTHRLDRFWLPILPPLAILAGLGADWTRSRAWWAVLAAFVPLSILTNLAYTSTALAGLNQWTDDLTRLRDEVPAMINRPLSRLDAGLPPDAKVLLVGQASVFHMRHPILYNTVFDDEVIETIARGRTPEEVARTLEQLGVSHVYVDWFEIDRHRRLGGYGFTPFVTPELFEGLVRAGVLLPATKIGDDQDLYAVRTRPAAGRLPPTHPGRDAVSSTPGPGRTAPR